MKRDILASLFVLAGTGALYWSLSLFDNPRAATFPRVIILIMGALALALLIQSLLVRSSAQKVVLQESVVEEEVPDEEKQGFPWSMVIATFVCVVVYFYVMEYLGFYFSAFLFFILITFVLGRKDLTVKKGVLRVFIAFVFTTILYILFTVVLKVQAPSGLVF